MSNNRFAALFDDSDDDSGAGSSMPTSLPSTAAAVGGVVLQPAGFTLQDAVFTPLAAGSSSLVLPSTTAAASTGADMLKGASFDLSDLVNSTETAKVAMDMGKAVQVRSREVHDDWCPMALFPPRLRVGVE